MKKFQKPRLKVDNEATMPWGFWNHLLMGLDRSCVSKAMFTIPVLPVTANHLYDKSLRKNKKTGKTTLSFNNKQEVEDLRMFVRVQMKRAKINWKPTGYCYVVIFVESSKWLNKDNTPKCKDIDNMPKSLNDAIMRATGIPDEMNFGVMEFKVPSEVERTRVFMYDMGVDHYFMEKDNGKGT